jgi:hypothetical protein
MTSGEIKTLLNTTENWPESTGRGQMTGPTRALLYRLALINGDFGQANLAALKESDFDLAGADGYAGRCIHTKNKKGASLPLRVDTVERLRAFLGG